MLTKFLNGSIAKSDFDTQLTALLSEGQRISPYPPSPPVPSIFFSSSPSPSPSSSNPKFCPLLCSSSSFSSFPFCSYSAPSLSSLCALHPSSRLLASFAEVTSPFLLGKLHNLFILSILRAASSTVIPTPVPTLTSAKRTYPSSLSSTT